MAHRMRFAAGAGGSIVAVVVATALAAGGASAAAQPGGQPTAETSPPTNVTSSTATLNGVAGPGFKIVQSAEPTNIATYLFQYGTTAAYGSQTPPGFVNSTQSVSANVTGLSPCTTYHFRIVVSDSGAGTADGVDKTFTTAASNPALGVKAPKRARHGRRFALRVTLSSPAHVTIFITRRGHDVRTISEGQRHVGAFTARIRAPHKTGRYRLRIVANADCASQTVSKRLKVR